MESILTYHLLSSSQTVTNFGLINQTYSTDCGASTNLTQWQRFNRVLFELNQQAASNVVYKLLFIGRHGEGYHNAAESFYGTPAWNVSSISSQLTFFILPISDTLSVLLL